MHLRAAKVLGRAEREQQIRKALDAATRTIPGARWREDKALLDIVVNLTEYPSVIMGGFDPQFLLLPEEVLVTVMRDHQKYFAVEDADEKLLPHFLAVLNTDSDPQGSDPARQRASIACALQRCPILLGDGPEEIAARSGSIRSGTLRFRKIWAAITTRPSACSGCAVGSARF